VAAQQAAQQGKLIPSAARVPSPLTMLVVEDDYDNADALAGYHESERALSAGRACSRCNALSPAYQ
jgi:hypothetical protein